ncbi:Lactoylglutathione lyase / glyoxalase I family protein [Quillaja saponaria]|uniref:Lactoylglutathione lyase / glyoxalase I family protein n=1 Tax=Quillaja saponaria TaxID=32244 RepID=A0AAD7L087_QUISA|nr:Lactoylglutathione lyase / glyoxalase I family protein [Quillaja saponaria]
MQVKKDQKKEEAANYDENIKGGGKKKEGHEEEAMKEENPLPLMALNHVSRLCKNVKESMDFYTKVLGFVLIERPQAFDFDGAWLFNYGVGIHLVLSEDETRLPHTDDLDPIDNHISFQCEDMETMERRLKELNVKYKKRTVEDDESETAIDQLFFNDPDGFMVEICNCENLKLVPAGSFGKIKLPFDRHNQSTSLR